MARRFVSRTIGVLSVLTLGVAASGGCGSTNDAPPDPLAGSDGSGGTNGPDGTGGPGPGRDSASPGNDGSVPGTDGSVPGTDGSSTADTSIPDVSFVYDAPLRDVTVTPDSACATTGATANRTPIDMFVMLDQSGSMGTDCNVGSATNSKWCNAINALSTYFKGAASTGQGAALQYFELPGGNCSNGNGYNVSAIPATGNGYVTLPSSAFDASLNAHTPNSLTPTEGAIRGITGFTSRAVNRLAGRKPIGILITDGDPSSCNTNLTTLRGLLQSHFTATGTMTFVVGMTGATDANLETLALGGNAPPHAATVNGVPNTCGSSAAPCRHWNVGNGNAAVFVEALKAISAAAVGCAFTIPPSSTGVIDPNTVRVEYLPGGAPPAQILGRVTDAAACAGVPNGFYYDNNVTPTTINLCASQCNVVQADPTAKINVLFGCAGG